MTEESGWQSAALQMAEISFASNTAMGVQIVGNGGGSYGQYYGDVDKVELVLHNNDYDEGDHRRITIRWEHYSGSGYCGYFRVYTDTGDGLELYQSDNGAQAMGNLFFVHDYISGDIGCCYNDKAYGGSGHTIWLEDDVLETDTPYLAFGAYSSSSYYGQVNFDNWQISQPVSNYPIWAFTT